MILFLIKICEPMKAMALLDGSQCLDPGPSRPHRRRPFYHTTIQQSRKRGEERVQGKQVQSIASLACSGPYLHLMMLAIEIFSEALTLKFRLV